MHNGHTSNKIVIVIRITKLPLFLEVIAFYIRFTYRKIGDTIILFNF